MGSGAVTMSETVHYMTQTQGKKVGVLKVRDLSKKLDVRLPGKGNSNTHGARPVYQNHLDDEVDSDQ